MVTLSCLGGRLYIVPMFIFALAFCFSVFSGVFCLAQEQPKSIPDAEFRERLHLSKDPEPVLKSILERDEFKRAKALSYYQQIRDKILEWIEGIVARLFRKIPTPNVTAEELETFWQILVGALFTVVLGVLAFIFFRKRRLTFSKAGGSLIPRPGFREKPMTSEAARMIARKLSDQGNFAQALIHLFRATILWLDEQGKLTFYSGKTNREILAGINKDEPAAVVLGQMIPVFDRIRYGNGICRADEYEKFSEMTAKITTGD